MRFTFTEAQEAFRKEVHDFLEAELQAGTFAIQSRGILSPSSREFSLKMAERGWIGFSWPKEFWGQGRSYVDKMILNEELTIRKLIGAAAILSGVLIAEWRKRALVVNRGAVCVLLAALCFAASGTISFLIVRSFDVLSYMFYSSVLVTSMLAAFRPRVFRKLSFYLEPRRGLNVVATSLNDALANLLGFTACDVGRNALQTNPILATQTLLTVLLAVAILKERDHLSQKITGSVAGVIGTILLL